MFGWRSGQASIEIGHDTHRTVFTLSYPPNPNRVERNIPLLLRFLNCFNSLRKDRMATSQVHQPVGAVEAFFLKGGLKLSLLPPPSWDGGRLGVGDANRD